MKRNKVKIHSRLCHDTVLVFRYIFRQNRREEWTTSKKEIIEYYDEGTYRGNIKRELFENWKGRYRLDHMDMNYDTGWDGSDS
jgi:hypothetical protein